MSISRTERATPEISWPDKEVEDRVGNEGHAPLCQHYRPVTRVSEDRGAKYRWGEHVRHIIAHERIKQSMVRHIYVRVSIRCFRDHFLSLHVRGTRAFATRFTISGIENGLVTRCEIGNYVYRDRIEGKRALEI